MVCTLLDAYLSSQEETLFGNFLEGLAIFINSIVYGGRKSSSEGIDLEFDKDETRFIVAIKSGPNWGNSSQIKRMIQNFRKATRILRTSNSRLHVVAVNGCCYGKNRNADKGEYLKYCGKEFWELISGEPDMYVDIIEPLGHKSRERNQEFQEGYSEIVNMFTAEFNGRFCFNGKINWNRLVQYNSGKISWKEI